MPLTLEVGTYISSRRDFLYELLNKESMTTDILIKQLNKEMKTLRREVTEMKTVLLRVLAIPEESLEEYRNASAIQKALRKSQKTFPRS